MMAAERKIAEATECIQKAEKCLKTGFLKWRPDYDSAANEYNRAATCFKAAKLMEQCKDCFMKTANCYKQNGSFFSAAKSYEQAAMVCRDMKNTKETADLVEKACQLFQEHGSPDTAAMALERGSKMIESTMPERASHLLQRAADVVMLEDRPRQAAEYTSKVSRILVKLGRYDEATESIAKEIQFMVSVGNEKSSGRLVVALVLVHLGRDDLVAASKAYRDGMSYLEGEELDTLSTIIEAYEDGDKKRCQQALAHPFIRHMDVEYSKLARNLRIPGGPEETFDDTNSNSTTEHVAPKAPVLGDDVDDEYADGLC